MDWFSFAKFSWLSLALALVTLLSPPAEARPAAILDDGAFFSESAKGEAARNIGDLEKSVRKDLAIETFRELPVELKAGLNLEDKTAVSRAIQQWAISRAKSQAVNGVYILLVKNPAHLQVEVGNDTQRQAFTLHDRDQLVSLMLGKLRAKNNDGALLDAVSFVSSTMRAHLPNQTRLGSQPVEAPRGYLMKAPATHSSVSWFLPLLLGVGVVWLIIGIIRAFTNSGGTPMGGSSVNPGGGGGFLSSLFGGMFGAAAGMWMYNQFFGDHGTSAWGANQNSFPDNNQNTYNDQGFSGQDTDYSGSGGDFSDSSGSGNDSSSWDSGSSGDSGGGGGDFGGGGDSGGSGGGDF